MSSKLSGLFFGSRGGLLASLSIFLLYLPHLILQWQAPFASQADRFLELGLFIVVGILVGVIVSSERKQRQKAQQAERLALIGQTAATMAHEIKNPLRTRGIRNAELFLKSEIRNHNSASSGNQRRKSRTTRSRK